MQGMMAAQSQLAETGLPIVKESSSLSPASQRQGNNEQLPVKVSLLEDPSHGAASGGDADAAASETGKAIGPRVASLSGLARQVFNHLPKVLGNFKGARRGSSMEGIFPLPLPADHQGQQCELNRTWEEGVIRSFNWMFCNSFHLGNSPPNIHQTRLLAEIRRSLVLLKTWGVLEFNEFNPDDFFRQRWINSYGEEVHVAKPLRWENIATSLPAQGLAGILPAADVSKDGFKDFLLQPDRWLKPIASRTWIRPPRVQVPPDAWKEVVEGLIRRQVCGIMPLSEAFCVEGQPILGGLFGVPKNEWTQDGTEVLRLIMDLRPINENFLPLGGDLSTLPVLSQMVQLEVHPSEGLIISSEDIRAMFYIIGVPPVWNQFLGFSRPIPRELRPVGAREDYILYSKVLPMGFVNSVSVAQHLHRQIIALAFKDTLNFGHEIRRDREFPSSSVWFRTYLDNFDLLSKQSQAILETDHGSLMGKLRDTYNELGIPRNEKKRLLKQPAPQKCKELGLMEKRELVAPKETR